MFSVISGLTTIRYISFIDIILQEIFPCVALHTTSMEGTFKPWYTSYTSTTFITSYSGSSLALCGVTTCRYTFKITTSLLYALVSILLKPSGPSISWSDQWTLIIFIISIAFFVDLSGMFNIVGLVHFLFKMI